MYHTYDFRAHLDVLYMILTIEDSSQDARLFFVLKGIAMFNEKTSSSTTTNHCANEAAPQNLFDMFVKSKSTYQKKAYYCIKILVQLFSK